MPDAGSVSVGDLVVRLTGDTALLEKAVNNTTVLMVRVEDSAQKAQQAIDDTFRQWERRQKDVMNRMMEQERHAPTANPANQDPEKGPWAHLLKGPVGTHLARMFGGGMVAGELRLMTHLVSGVGLGVAGAVVGAVALGEVLKKALESYVGLHKAQADWHFTIGQEIRKAQHESLSVIDSTELGREMRNKAMEAGEEWRKIQHEQKNEIFEREHSIGGLFSRMGSTMGEGFGLNFFDKQQALRRQQIQFYRQQQDQFEEVSENESRVQIRRNAEDREMATRSAEINRMYEGPARRRVALEHDLAKERKQIEREHEDRSRAMEAALEREWDMTKHPLNQTSENPEWIEFSERAEKKRASLTKERKADLAAFEEQAFQRSIGMERDTALEREAIRNSAYEAELALKHRGFNREVELLDFQYRTRINQAQRAGQDTYDIEREWNAKRGLLYKEHNRDLRIMLEDLEAQTQEALSPMLRAQGYAQWQSTARRMKEDEGRTPEEIEKAKQAYDKLHKAQSERPLIEDLKMSQIQLGVMTGSVTRLQGEFLKLRRQYPTADPALLASVAAFHDTMEKLQPMQPGQFGKYTAGQVDIGGLNVGVKNYTTGDTLSSLETLAAGSGSAGYVQGQVRPASVGLGRDNAVAGEVQKTGEILARIDQKIAQLLSQGLN